MTIWVLTNHRRHRAARAPFRCRASRARTEAPNDDRAARRMIGASPTSFASSSCPSSSETSLYYAALPDMTPAAIMSYGNATFGEHTPHHLDGAHRVGAIGPHDHTAPLVHRNVSHLQRNEVPDTNTGINIPASSEGGHIFHY